MFPLCDNKGSSSNSSSFSFPFPSPTESSPWTTAALLKMRKLTRYQSPSLLPAVCHSSHSSLQPTNSPPHSGHALRGEAQHICERHHKLRHLPLQPRHLPAHRHRLPEEPAGHAVVSWRSGRWGAEGWGGSPPLIFLALVSSFVLFPSLHRDFCLVTPPSETHTMGKLVFFGLHDVVAEHWVSEWVSE